MSMPRGEVRVNQLRALRNYKKKHTFHHNTAKWFVICQDDERSSRVLTACQGLRPALRRDSSRLCGSSFECQRAFTVVKRLEGGNHEDKATFSSSLGHDLVSRAQHGFEFRSLREVWAINTGCRIVLHHRPSERQNSFLMIRKEVELPVSCNFEYQRRKHAPNGIRREITYMDHTTCEYHDACML